MKLWYRPLPLTASDPRGTLAATTACPRYSRHLLEYIPTDATKQFRCLYTWAECPATYTGSLHPPSPDELVLSSDVLPRTGTGHLSPAGSEGPGVE